MSARYENGPFGEEITRRGVGAQPYRFSTKYHDEETGLLYYGYRYYAPRLGRWLSKDPIGERGGVNLYGFVGNDGVNKWDYLGWAGYKIGVPVEPQMLFDEDFPYDPNATTKIEDYLFAACWSTISLGAELFASLPDAVRAYNHYRGGSGSELRINYSKAYREDSVVANYVNREISAAQAEAEKLWDGKSASFQMTGEAVGVPNGSSENWQKTIGAHFIWGSAVVMPKCEKDGVWTMVITIREKDRYNFNRNGEDIATGIKDRVNGRFMQIGWAKSFFTTGSLRKTVKWKKGKHQQH